MKRKNQDILKKNMCNEWYNSTDKVSQIVLRLWDSLSDYDYGYDDAKRKVMSQGSIENAIDVIELMGAKFDNCDWIIT